MSTAVASITFDCARPYELARFWSQAVDFPIDPDAKPDDDEIALLPPDGHPMILFIRVPEGKTVKNRLHLDLRPRDRSRDAEVDRLIGLGARQVDDRRTPDGKGWVVLADPEGNELCVERSAAERVND